MDRRKWILMTLCTPLIGIGCKKVPEIYNFQQNNVTEADIWAWIQLDKQRWDGFVLVGKRGKPYGGQKISFGNSLPWPRRLVVRWILKGIEGVREQEMEVPPHPLMLDGTFSVYPFLYLIFFEDRVLMFSYYRGIDREIEEKARVEYEAAHATGIPGARIVDAAEGYRRLEQEGWQDYPEWATPPRKRSADKTENRNPPYSGIITAKSPR